MERFAFLMCAVAAVALIVVMGGKAHAATSCSGVNVTAQNSIQKEIDSHGSGTTFCIRKGSYRLTKPLHPRSGDRFIGINHPVLNGSKRITSFTHVGTRWVAGNQTQQGPTSGKCDPGVQACGRPEELFIDGNQLTQVGSLTSLKPGSFYFDYATNKIFIAQNPSGHSVEASVATRAFSAWGKNVTVKGFKVEKFSTPTSSAAIQGASGWLIQNNDVFKNSAAGICVTGAGHVIANHVHNNGQLGLCAQGTGPVFKGNESDSNNTQHFRYTWEAGGGKFCHIHNAVIANNYFHNNYAIGMWVDVNSDGVTIDGNRSIANKAVGIEVEISYNVTVKNNIVKGNGFSYPGVDGTGMKISSSPNVSVYGNTLVGNNNAIMLVQQNRPTTSLSKGPHLVRNNKVHDNKIDIRHGAEGGVVESGSTGLCSSTSGNRFAHNNYTMSSTHPTPFNWCAAKNLTKPGWQSKGNDITAAFSS
jgi:parallel beta-helix repeat protein